MQPRVFHVKEDTSPSEQPFLPVLYIQTGVILPLYVTVRHVWVCKYIVYGYDYTYYT